VQGAYAPPKKIRQKKFGQVARAPCPTPMPPAAVSGRFVVVVNGSRINTLAACQLCQIAS
jgi:hypothetical protein